MIVKYRMIKKLKRTLLLSLLVCGSQAFANEPSFELGGKKVDFYRDEEKHLTISKSCIKSGGKFACQAYSALSKISLSSLSHKGGGANPGARICTSQLKGEVVIGRDSQGNENSFCRLDDGSLVSSGTLMFYGRENDAKQN
jgi:hypothetical protein